MEPVRSGYKDELFVRWEEGWRELENGMARRGQY